MRPPRPAPAPEARRPPDPLDGRRYPRDLVPTSAHAVAALLATVATAPQARAHLGQHGATSLAHDPLVQGASLFAVLLILLGGLGYLTWRTRRGEGPDGTWTLAVLGMGWVVLAVAIPPRVLAEAPMTWTGWGLVLGSFGLAAWVAWERAGPVLPDLRGDAGAKMVAWGVLVSYLPLHALAARVVAVPDPWAAAEAGALPHLGTYVEAGPVTVWPGLAWWSPTLGVGGHVTPALAASLLVHGGLVALAAGLLWITRGGWTGPEGPRLRLAAACLAVPVMADLAIILLGPAATPLLHAIGSPEVGLHSALLVARVWLLVTGTALAAGAAQAHRQAPGASRRGDGSISRQ